MFSNALSTDWYHSKYTRKQNNESINKFVTHAYKKHCLNITQLPPYEMGVSATSSIIVSFCESFNAFPAVSDDSPQTAILCNKKIPAHTTGYNQFILLDNKYSPTKGVTSPGISISMYIVAMAVLRMPVGYTSGVKVLKME